MKNGEPCSHTGCLHHISHPCEGCGRIAGYPVGVNKEMNKKKNIVEIKNGIFTKINDLIRKTCGIIRIKG